MTPNRLPRAARSTCRFAAERLSGDDLAGTLGEVVANHDAHGSRAGLAPDAITVFDSTGLAVQDLAVGRIVYEKGVEKNVGTHVQLRDQD